MDSNIFQSQQDSPFSFYFICWFQIWNLRFQKFKIDWIQKILTEKLSKSVVQTQLLLQQKKYFLHFHPIHKT